MSRLEVKYKSIICSVHVRMVHWGAPGSKGSLLLPLPITVCGQRTLLFLVTCSTLPSMVPHPSWASWDACGTARSGPYPALQGPGVLAPLCCVHHHASPFFPSLKNVLQSLICCLPLLVIFVGLDFLNSFTSFCRRVRRDVSCI